MVVVQSIQDKQKQNNLREQIKYITKLHYITKYMSWEGWVQGCQEDWGMLGWVVLGWVGLVFSFQLNQKMFEFGPLNVDPWIWLLGLKAGGPLRL